MPRIPILGKDEVLRRILVKPENVDQYQKTRILYNSRWHSAYFRKDAAMLDEELKRKAAPPAGPNGALRDHSYWGMAETGGAFVDKTRLEVHVTVTHASGIVDEVLEGLNQIAKQAFLPLVLGLSDVKPPTNKEPALVGLEITKNEETLEAMADAAAALVEAWIAKNLGDEVDPEGALEGGEAMEDAREEIRRRNSATLGLNGRYRTPDGRFSRRPLDD